MKTARKNAFKKYRPPRSANTENFLDSRLDPLLKKAAAAAAAAAFPARTSPIELRIGILTLRSSDCKRSKAGLKTPRFRKVMIETSWLRFPYWKMHQKIRIFVSARSPLDRRVFRFFLHFRLEYVPISP